MRYGQAEAGEGGIDCQNRTRQGAEYRAPQDVLERVLVVNATLPSAPTLNLYSGNKNRQ